jgi:hypothetical protein
MNCNICGRKDANIRQRELDTVKDTVKITRRAHVDCQGHSEYRLVSTEECLTQGITEIRELIVIDYKVGDKVSLKNGKEAEVVGTPFMQKEDQGMYVSTECTTWFWVRLSEIGSGA